MPLYGRAFENAQGLGKPYSGVGEGSWENGIWDYKALPLAGAEEFLDPEVGASYSVNEASGKIVSFDTLAMTRVKAQFVEDKGLGGLMWWESSADRPRAESLLNVVWDFVSRSEVFAHFLGVGFQGAQCEGSNGRESEYAQLSSFKV